MVLQSRTQADDYLHVQGSGAIVGRVEKRLGDGGRPYAQLMVKRIFAGFRNASQGLTCSKDDGKEWAGHLTRFRRSKRHVELGRSDRRAAADVRCRAVLMSQLPVRSLS